MKETKYNLQFDRLCQLLQLGACTSIPKPISGGLLNKMFLVETTKGRYAVKALNPAVMQRPTAMKRYILSEQIAEIASSKLPVLPAKRFKGSFIHELDDQYYMIFDWIEGKSLGPEEINIEHCTQIGSILGKLHGMDFSKLNALPREHTSANPVDWNFYLQQGRERQSLWVELLQENIPYFYRWSQQADEASKLLMKNQVLSHRDLDPKNVLWSQNKPIIIDWEAAGYINSMKEFIETAISWSIDETGSVNKQNFFAFIEGYQQSYGQLHGNWEDILFSSLEGKFGWLEYSFKRSLCIECTDADEQQLGTIQAVETIREIKQYAEWIPVIKGWLAEIMNKID